MYDMIAAAQYMGHIFIAAAGNEATNSDTFANYPSGYDLPNVLSVAASTDIDTLSSFSNYGVGPGAPDLAAPGSGITSTFPGGSYVT
jgi:hypothetical protein